MAAEFQIKRGDLMPPLQCTLVDVNGAPVDLTLATEARLLIRNLRGLKVNASMSISANGVCKYTWQPVDTDTTGTYQAEIQVTWSDSTIQTFPTDGYFTVQVVKDLGP